MVAQEAGIPLLFPLSKDKYNENSSFLSGCYTLGEILENKVIKSNFNGIRC